MQYRIWYFIDIHVLPVKCSLTGRFGQTTPPLVEFLKDILRRYPEGGQILKVGFVINIKSRQFYIQTNAK